MPVDQPRETYVQVRLPSGEVVSVPRREWKALRVAAENEQATNRQLAEKLFIEADSYNNYMTRLYVRLKVNGSVDKRRAAIAIYKDNSEVREPPSEPIEGPIIEEPAVEEPLKEELVVEEPRKEEPVVVLGHDHAVAYQAVLLALYVAFVAILFGGIQIIGSRDGIWNKYANLYSTVPILGGIFLIARHVQLVGRFTLKDHVSVGIASAACGLIAWGVGGYVWLFYNLFLGIMVPYPSGADAGFVLGAFGIAVGTRNLFLVSLRRSIHRLIFALSVIFVFVAGNLVVLLWLRGWTAHPDDPAKLILDLAAQSMTFYALTLLYIYFTQVNSQVSKSISRVSFSYTIGMLLYLFADASYSYRTTLSSDHPFVYYTGDFSDLLYFSGLFIISMSLLSLVYPQEK